MGAISSMATSLDGMSLEMQVGYVGYLLKWGFSFQTTPLAGLHHQRQLSPEK